MHQSDFPQHSSCFMSNNPYQQPKAPSDTDNMALHYFCSNSVSSDINNNNNNFTILDNTVSSSLSTMIQTTDSYTPKYHRISSITSIGSTSTSSKRKVKKNKKSRKNNKKSHKLQSYDPVSTHRAQGITQITKKMTEQIIPSSIKQQICNIYVYMDKSIALCDDNNFTNDHIKVINFDFHDKKTNEVLYCVSQKQDDTKKSSRGYQWKLMDKLFTAYDIYNQYKIDNISLPKSVRDSCKFESELRDGEKIKQFLMNSSQWQKLLTKANWCKIGIFTKVNNKRRMTLSVTKPEFIKICSDFMNNTKQIKLVPILMFSSNEYKYWIEHLWIVRMQQEQIDIGISFKYDSKQNNVITCGVHLDKECILRQHQLVLPQHKCHCLDNFQTNINDLTIGNPDDDKNRIKYYKQQIEELQRKLQTFENNNNNFNVNKICGDKSGILNIQTTCLIQQESDNCYYNNNDLMPLGLNITGNDQNEYYNIPQTPKFDAN